MNRYWVDQPTKTTPTSADIVCIRDVADSDKTKKSILSNLWTAIWGTNDSDNINEWATNLFYTTARNLLKANESEVIHNTWNESWITWTKSWTYTLSTTWNITATEFIWDWTNLTNVPVSITGQTEEPAITDWDELAFYDTTAGANRKIDYTDLTLALWWDIWLKTNTIIFSKTLSDATVTTQYSHWLWRVPKLITFHAIYATNQWSHWAYDWTTSTCVWATGTPGSFSATGYSIQPSSNTGNTQQWVVTAMTATTFDITWTKIWAWTWTASIVATLIS